MYFTSSSTTVSRQSPCYRTRSPGFDSTRRKTRTPGTLPPPRRWPGDSRALTGDGRRPVSRLFSVFPPRLRLPQCGHWCTSPAGHPDILASRAAEAVPTAGLPGEGVVSDCQRAVGGGDRGGQCGGAHQVAVDRGCCAAALGDGPDDQRRPAPSVAGHEHSVPPGAEAGVAGETAAVV